MADPLVSALINTYNYGHFVEEAVESVLAQDYSAHRLEIIVADDGSTDDTALRMARFAGRVRYLRLEHRGQATALNAAIAASHGEILAFLDADDLWRPEKVRRVVEAFNEHPEAGMVYHAFELWRSDGQPMPQPDFRAISGTVYQNLEDLLTIDGQATSGQAFRRAVVETMLPLPEEFVIGCSDGYLCYNCILGWPVVALATPLTRYRIHGNNQFNFSAVDPRKLRIKLACWQALMREHRAWLRRQGHDLGQPRIEAFLRRQDLLEAMMQFGIEPPGRVEFFRHLRREARVYRPIWSLRYRIFKAVEAGTALLLGFPAFNSLKRRYQMSPSWRRLRELALPRLQAATRSQIALEAPSAQAGPDMVGRQA